jgi:hypothetical protein
MCGHAAVFLTLFACHYVLWQVPPIRGGAAQWVMFDDDQVSAFSEARLPGNAAIQRTNKNCAL